jgi:hypothetical protein
MSTRPQAGTDPLAPIEFAVTCLSALISLGIAFSLLAAVFGSGSFLGIGESDACAVVDSGTVGYGEGDVEVAGLPPVRHSPFIVGLHRDASFVPETLRVCDDDPGAGVRAASSAGRGAELVLLLGFLLLTWRVIRKARQSGLFTGEVAGGAQVLGWFLLVGSVLVPVLSWAADGVVVTSAVGGVSWPGTWDHIHPSWTVMLVAFGLLSVARVLRRAVALQDDVDATI